MLQLVVLSVCECPAYLYTDSLDSRTPGVSHAKVDKERQEINFMNCIGLFWHLYVSREMILSSIDFSNIK